MSVAIQYTTRFMVVSAFYNAEFIAALNNNDIKREFRKDKKVWIFSLKDKDDVLKLLNDYYGTNYENSVA